MMDSIVSAVGGYEQVSNYSRGISEFGKLATIAGVVGVVASPIFGGFGLSLGTAALGYMTWDVFHELSRDFRVVDKIIKQHLANHEAWLDSRNTEVYSPIK